MSPAGRGVLAVDFGTTNTYVCKCPSNEVSPSGIDFHGGRDGLPTAILYRRDAEPLVGFEAMTEWGDATDAERRDYRLRTHFKPDIVSRPEAAEDAEAFLRALAEGMRRERLVDDLAAQEVIFGVPSEAGDSFVRQVRELACKTGFGRAATRDEPLGALLFHLWHKDLAPSDAQRGVLVVDFGGGTCDFACMSRLEVRRSWGDMALGGRLFDDLFYQWFLEQNPGAPDALAAAGDEYFVHWYECREMKEAFSRAMARDRGETQRKRLGRYGVVRDLTWDGFVQRARAYRPSESLRRELADAGGPTGKWGASDEPIDLLAWFRSALAEGFSADGIEPGDVSRVILAGGSSLWPFVADTVCELLRIDRQRVLRSERPYAVVATGLAILPAVQGRFLQAQRRLQEARGTFLAERVSPLLDQRLETIAARVARDVTVDLYDGTIREILVRFRADGGSIAGVKEQIATAIRTSGGQLRDILAEHMGRLTEGLAVQLQELVAEWFAGEQMRYDPGNIRVAGVRDVEALRVQAPDLYREMTDLLTGVTAAISAAVVASICGGGGLALIMTGPVGLVIGAVIGAAAVIGGTAGVRKWIERRRLSARVVGWMLSEGKMRRLLAQGRRRFQATVHRQIRDCSAEPIGELLKHIEHRIDREIDSLSAIDQL